MPSAELQGGPVTCVIQARTGSSRLPGKVLADVGGRPMLRFMLDRLRALEVGTLVVATSDLERDAPVADIATEAGVAVVRGPEADVLARFVVALDAHPAESVIRLTADCPLVDPSIVHDVLALHQQREADYTTNVLPRTFPKGLDVEVIRAETLRLAHAEAQDPAEREHVTPFVYRHPERFALANLRHDTDLGRERWTVDTADDLRFVQDVVGRLGPDHDFGWRDVLALVGRTAPPQTGLHLRTAMPGDGGLLLALRNDPDAVRSSLSGRAVEPDEHERWWAERLADPGARIWIAEQDGESVGFVRLQIVAGVGEVSIALAPDRRGQGRGTALLRLLQAELADDVQVVALEAMVHSDNLASATAFERAGFTPVAQRGTFALLRWARMDPRKEGS